MKHKIKLKQNKQITGSIILYCNRFRPAHKYPAKQVLLACHFRVTLSLGHTHCDTRHTLSHQKTSHFVAHWIISLPPLSTISTAEIGTAWNAERHAKANVYGTLIRVCACFICPQVINRQNSHSKGKSNGPNVRLVSHFFGAANSMQSNCE